MNVAYKNKLIIIGWKMINLAEKRQKGYNQGKNKLDNFTAEIILWCSVCGGGGIRE